MSVDPAEREGVMPPDHEDQVNANMGLVFDLARKLDRGEGVGPSRSDLVSAGVVGLIQALQSFDPSRGLAFSTLAVQRIRGAMLDEIRRWDHAPRSVRKKERELKKSEAELRANLDRTPTATELADDLSLTAEELHQWRLDVARHSMDSLDEAPQNRDESAGATRIQTIVGDTGVGILDRIGRDEAIEIMGRVLFELPERERRVLTLYYYEGLRLHQIAEVFEVTESRVSQIRHKALRTLRSKLNSVGVQEP